MNYRAIKIVIIAFSTIIFFLTGCDEQTEDNPITFNKTYNVNGDNQHFFGDAVETPDNGYIAVGSSSGFLRIVKTTKNGAIAWDKTYPNHSNDAMKSSKIIPQNDTGYVIFFMDYIDDHINLDFYLMKIDSAGNEVWVKQYNLPWSTQFFSHENQKDGFLLYGQSPTDDTGMIIKLDEQGNEITRKYYSINKANDVIENFTIQAINRTNDNGYILSGTYQNENYCGRFCSARALIKTDEALDVEWTKQDYDYGNLLFIKSIYPEDDRGFIMFENIVTLDSVDYMEASILKTDADGTILWRKYFGDSYTEPTGIESAIKTKEGHYVSAGWRTYNDTSFEHHWESWLMKIDAKGDTIWSNYFHNSEPANVNLTSDKGFILSGFGSPKNDPAQAMLIKTDALGNAPQSAQ